MLFCFSNANIIVLVENEKSHRHKWQQLYFNKGAGGIRVNAHIFAGVSQKIFYSVFALIE